MTMTPSLTFCTACARSGTTAFAAGRAVLAARDKGSAPVARAAMDNRIDMG